MLKFVPNKKDYMTPVERAKAIERGENYDRVPMDPFLGEIKARYIGKNTREYWLDEDNLVKAEVEAFNKFGYDGVGVGPNAYGIAEAIGIEAFYPEKGLIYVKNHKIDVIEEAATLSPLNMNSGRLGMYYNATARLREMGDGIVPVGVSLSGPLTLAGFVLGTEKLLKAMIRKPEKVHIFLRYITECMKFVADEFAKLDVGFSMADPIASITMISPRMYRDFAFPYTKELCGYLYSKHGKKPSYHVCGSTEKAWPYIKELGISCFSIDNQVDILKACEYFRNSCAVAGNVDPVRVICEGDRNLIYNESIKCLEAGRICEKGFILTPGCNLPLNTSDENIDAFMDAGRKFSSQFYI